MADYYVDVDSPGAWDGCDGTNNTTELLKGLSGLQYALDTVTAGNRVLIKCASSDGRTLKSLACDNLSGTFVRGEEVTWDAGASTGVVSEITSDYPSVIEVTAGTLADDDALVGSTSAATADVNGAPTVKSMVMDIDTNSGTTANGPITYCGCNSSWSVDGTQAVIDGQNNAAGAQTGLGGSATTKEYLYFMYLTFTRFTYGAYDHDQAGTTRYFKFFFCFFIDNYSFGIKSDWNTYTYSLFYKCKFINSGQNVLSNSMLLFCVCTGNNGWNALISGGLCYGCIIHGNTGPSGGVALKSDAVINCVVDGNSSSGIEVSSTELSVCLGCRITNNGAYGMKKGTNGVAFDDYNFFKSNVSGARDIASTKLSIEGDNCLTDGTEGYNDRANDDFNLTSDASLRRTEIDLGIGT